MSFNEILLSIILPVVGAVGGISTLLIFMLSKNQREAQVRLLDNQGNEVATLTPAKLQQLMMESAEKVFAAQNALIDDLRSRLDSEIGSREETIKELKTKLSNYENENAQLREDNKKLNRKIADQNQEISRLNKRIGEQDEEIQKLKEQFAEVMERRDGC